VAVGQVVRLRDEHWPASAQMHVLGRVESVEKKESAPLRSVVVVRPEIDPRRVSRVVIYGSGGGQ
jgi:hypothetical protein